MRALADYESTLCPLCGLPRSVCQTPEAIRPALGRGHLLATAHMQESMRQWQDSNKTSPARNALVAHLTD